MKRILQVLTAALAFLFNQRNHVTELKRQVDERDKVIKDLREALAAEDADDESREEALKSANERAEQLQAELDGLVENLDAAKIQAEALAKEINDDPSIPLEVGSGGAPVKELPVGMPPPVTEQPVTEQPVTEQPPEEE